MQKLLTDRPDGVCLSSFWAATGENLGVPDFLPEGLEGFSGPPLGAGFDADDLYCRLADTIHRDGKPLLLSARIMSRTTSNGPAVLSSEGYHQLTRYALAHGRLAQRLDAHYLILGTHWGQVGPRLKTQEMRMILAAVRTVFKGIIVYASSLENLDDSLLWQSADAMALSGPIPLQCRRDNPSQGLLSRTCKGLLRKISSLRSQNPKPFFITDVGYPTRAGGHLNPLDSKKARLEPSLPVRATRALHETFLPMSWYRGLGLFAWGCHPVESRDKTLALQGKSIVTDLLSKSYSSRRKSK